MKLSFQWLQFEKDFHSKKKMFFTLFWIGSWNKCHGYGQQQRFEINLKWDNGWQFFTNNNNGWNSKKKCVEMFASFSSGEIN
jgi:hypothetical protein